MCYFFIPTVTQLTSMMWRDQLYNLCRLQGVQLSDLVRIILLLNTQDNYTKIIVAQLGKNFLSVYGMQMYTAMFTRPASVPHKSSAHPHIVFHYHQF